jgi:hypothetical protein
MDSSSPEAMRGLREMRDLYVYWAKEAPAILKRWEQRAQPKEHRKT